MDKSGDTDTNTVNDAFVMKAWGKALEPSNASGVRILPPASCLLPLRFHPLLQDSQLINSHQLRYLADPDAKFTKALEVDFDASAILGNFRSKRYALTTEDGKITKVAIEPDNIGVDVSAVDKVLA
jgi:2-Cys peroxiredoxin 5